MLVAVLSAALAASAPLDAGDVAWCAGDREQARASWQEAADQPEPAVIAMARYRLLLVSGNVGLIVHGPAGDAALARCPPGEPWCDLARADRALILAELGLTDERAEALRLTERAAAALPGPALARAVWAGEADASALAAVERDGLGEGLLAAGRWPQGPGTWFVGLGALGAPGLGVGGIVRFVHPDLRWRAWRLTTTAALTSRGSGTLALQVATAGEVWAAGAASGGRLVAVDYAAEEAFYWWNARAWAGPGLRRGRWAAWGGPLFHLDLAPDPLPGHGLAGGARWQRGALAADLGGEIALASYRYQRVEAGVQAEQPLGRGRLLARLEAAAAPRSEQAPWWRLPAAGGGDALRSAPAGRWRGPYLAATLLEAERAVVGPLGVAVFAEGAWIEGLHAGAGAGLRLRLPPQPDNTARLDLAWGGEGLVVTAGWGR